MLKYQKKQIRRQYTLTTEIIGYEIYKVTIDKAIGICEASMNKILKKI